MARFKKEGSKELPGLNTSSMPDIIFMMLIFFMMTTSTREVELKVKIKPPEASEVQKLEKKALVSYIYVGPPVQSKLGTESRIQLNDSFRNISDIAEFVFTEREARDEVDRQLLTTSLKVDKEVKMGIVTDVKQELRKVGAFKINYSVRKSAVKTNN